MINLAGPLTAEQCGVIAVDTSELGKAQELAGIARQAGAVVIKQGLELASAKGASWEFCAQNAASAGVDWIADAKIHDIPNTTAGIVRNLSRLEHPPVGITIHTHSGVDSMKAAQEIAGEAGITMFGVTELTSITEAQLRETYMSVLAESGAPHGAIDCIDLRKVMVRTLGLDAHTAGIEGLVASALELRDPIKADVDLRTKLTLIPGTRSPGEAAHDQKNVVTPQQAMAWGATLLVLGRQVTASDNPAEAFRSVVEEIQAGINERQAA